MSRFQQEYTYCSRFIILVLILLLSSPLMFLPMTARAQSIDSSDLTAGSSELPIIGRLFPQPKPKQGTPVKRIVRTIDGKRLELIVFSSRVRRSQHGLDPFSREGYVSTRVAAKISGGRPGEVVTAKLRVGYSIGYPVSLSPEGVNITLTTPSLELTGQVDASLNPQITLSPSGGGGGIGQIGGQLGTQVTVIPPQQIQGTIAPGGIQDINVTDFSLTSQVAEVLLTGGHITVTSALGLVMIRPFAKLSVMTSVGVYDLELHNTHSSDVSL